MQARLVEYSRRDSPLHRMDARWKLAALTVGIVAVVALHTLATAALGFVLALALIALGRLPFGWFLARLGGVGLFLSLFLILLPLTMPGSEIALGPLRLSQAGLELAVLVCLKALAVVALGLVILATSPFETTLKAARALYVPGLLVQLLMLTYRYVFLFGDELGKVRIALRLRGFRNRLSRRTYRTIGQVLGTLLVRSFERAERVSQAMRCRGFDGRFRTLSAFHTRPADVAKFALLVLTAAGLCTWDLVLRKGGL